MSDYSPAYLEGIRLFNQGDYFNAHEVWEDAWNDANRRESSFYKGLIQLAVALCHFHNGNVRGATRLFHSGQALLQPFLPYHRGLDLAAFLDAITTCFTPVLEADCDWLANPDPQAPKIVLRPAKS